MVSQIRRLWSKENDLQGAAGLLVITMLLSNVLGFLRDLVLANTVPLRVLDTYYAAFRIPDFLFNLFILGAISSAFIPVYVDVKTKSGQSEAWKLVHNLIHTAFLVLLILGAVLFISMPQLLPHFIPGFSPEKIEATIPLARILLISPLFFAVSYVIGGVLNAHKKFFAYALAPLIYNVSIIVGGFLSTQYGVMAVTWSVVVGAFMHAFIQLTALGGLDYTYSFAINPTDPHIKRIIALMIPRSISLGMAQIVMLFFTRIGSYLPSGAVSIYSLTNNLQTGPVAIFAASIGTAVFPMLGLATSEKKDGEYKILLTDSLRGMLFYMIPSVAMLWVLRAHIIRIYLALNHQTWEDTIRAIDTFQWFILALVSQGVVIILIRAFHARQDTKRPMVISIVAGLVSIALAWILSGIIQDVSALSLAFAISSIGEALLLYLIFQIAHKGLINVRALIDTITSATLFSFAAALLARLTLSFVSEGVVPNTEGLGTDRIIPLFIAFLLAGTLGGGLYLVLAIMFKRDEMKWIKPKRAASSAILPEGEEIATDEGLL